MQIRAQETPREVRRLRRPHLESGATDFCRLPFSPSGELGPRPPSWILGPGPTLTRELCDRQGARAYDGPSGAE
eukprot:2460331-Alexandrium_andersonii.AAC.1